MANRLEICGKFFKKNNKNDQILQIKQSESSGSEEETQDFFSLCLNI